MWLLAGLLVLIIGVAILSVLGTQSSCAPSAQPSGSADKTIPANLMPLYIAAEQQYGVPWSLLAAINSVESDFGRNDSTSSAGAMGPMQFIPSTWASYGVDANGDGRKDIMDPADAIAGAARYLKANGAPKDLQRAVFAYNHAGWYVDKVLTTAKSFTSGASISDAEDCAQAAGGPADFKRAITLRSPREFKALPSDLVAPGFGSQTVDARILPDAIWVLRSYGLLITAGREPGHQTHGDGTAMDMVPKAGRGSQAAWDQSAGRLAKDLGWIPSCASTGVRPICPLVPAIQGVFYDGYPGHGSPRTCGGGCAQHIHVSWVSDTYGAYPGGVGPPPGLVKVFPVLGA